MTGNTDNWQLTNKSIKKTIFSTNEIEKKFVIYIKLASWSNTF